MKKIDFIHCRVSSETKKKLKDKARAMNMGLTELIEKIANEQVVFLDNNVKMLLEAMKLSPKVC